MAVTNSADMYSYLDQLGTQELEALLQKDAEDPDGGDLDMVMYIMEVIEKREGGVDKTAAADALKDFFSAYATPEGDGRCLYPGNDADDKEAKSDPPKELQKARRRRLSLKGAGLIAAVLVCVFSLAACSVGGIGRFSKWLGNGHLRCLPSRMRIRERFPKKLGQMHRSRRRMYNIAGSKMLWRPME